MGRTHGNIIPMRVTMTLQQAADVLEAYDAADDPVIFQHEETTPRLLTYHLMPNVRAADVQVHYGVRKSGEIVWEAGTLRDMALQRMAPRRKRPAGAKPVLWG